MKRLSIVISIIGVGIALYKALEDTETPMSERNTELIEEAINSDNEKPNSIDDKLGEVQGELV